MPVLADKHWVIVGNANELNAAYAADGYARVKGCPGVRKFFEVKTEPVSFFPSHHLNWL